MHNLLGEKYKMTDIFSLKLGSKIQKGIISNIIKEEAVDKFGTILPKIVLLIDIANNKQLRIDEAWVRDKHDELKAHGLWIKYDNDNNISQLSTIGKVMRYHSANTLRDLLGKEVFLFPKKNDFLALISTDSFNENEL
jgi:hypothetical protein